MDKMHQKKLLKCTTHSALLHCICLDNAIDVQLHKQVVKVISNGLRSKNKVTQLCANLANNGSTPYVCSSVNFICTKYNLTKQSL